MKRVLVLPEDFLEYAWEVEAKGVFWGGSVELASRRFGVTFYDPVRLEQDVRDEVASGRPVAISRLLVIARLTVAEMEAAVQAAPEEFFH